MPRSSLIGLVEKLIASNDSDSDEEGGLSVCFKLVLAYGVTWRCPTLMAMRRVLDKQQTVSSSSKTSIADEIKAALSSSTTKGKADTLDLAERNEVRHLEGETLKSGLRSASHSKRNRRVNPPVWR